MSVKPLCVCNKWIYWMWWHSVGWLMIEFKELFVRLCNNENRPLVRFALSFSLFSLSLSASLSWNDYYHVSFLIFISLLRLGLFAKQLTFIDRNRRMACVRAWAHSRSTNKFYSMFVITSSTIDQGVTLDEIIMFEMKLSDKIAIWWKKMDEGLATRRVNIDFRWSLQTLHWKKGGAHLSYTTAFCGIR